MFALDNIIRKACADRHHHPRARATTPADPDDVDEDPEGGLSQPHHSRRASVAQNEDSTAPNEDTVVTSRRSVTLQLGRMKLETNRLLEQLLEKEREYQAILQQVLDEREQEIRLLKLRSEPTAGTEEPHHRAA
uniref:Uncharacterized protein n=1 Tax=Knipowitschia caucasica TaxID=637954 RepID=A0AAV2KBW9_KNICA